jgi:hypothetical protein
MVAIFYLIISSGSSGVFFTFPFFSHFSNAQSDSFRGVGSHMLCIQAELFGATRTFKVIGSGVHNIF